MNKSTVILKAVVISLIIHLLFSGCGVKSSRKMTKPFLKPFLGLRLVPASTLPSISDDLDQDSLKIAIENSLGYFNRFQDRDKLFFGSRQTTVRDMKDTLVSFRNIMTGADSWGAKEEKIKNAFDFYTSVGGDEKGKVLFTGYYEPALEGSLKRIQKYIYPLYRVPDEKNIVTRYTRAEIDGGSALSGRNLEIVWLADPVDVFFLHIQGSGKVRLPDGRTIQIGYAQSNGYPYRSIGSYLIERGKLLKSEQSLQAIKNYLREHPDEAQTVFNYNERYIYFRLMDNGPLGALSIPVTAGRTIASDPEIYPRGALALIRTRKPVLSNGKIVSWTPFSRIVLSQDAGKAIIGPGRIDLFCGSGDEAGTIAGSLKETGELFFILKK